MACLPKLVDLKGFEFLLLIFILEKEEGWGAVGLARLLVSSPVDLQEQRELLREQSSEEGHPRVG